MNKQNFSYSWFFSVIFFLALLIPVHKFDTPFNGINKSFYGRKELITLAANTRVLIGDQVYPNAIIGKNGWLIYTGELSTGDYQNSIPFSDKELVLLQEKLDALSKKYAEEGITLLIVIAPNKNTIYSEYVPDKLEILGNESRLDQLLGYMDEHGETKILDLRSILFDAKDSQQVYYRTDTHWNSFGAFIAYQEMISILSTEHPEMRAFSASSFYVDGPFERKLDLTNIIGTTLIKEDVLNLVSKLQSNVEVYSVPIRGVPRNLYYSFNPDHAEFPSAVIFHDSFFTAVKPFIIENFSKALFIPHYTSVTDLDWWVQEQMPDIVIIEFTERYIDSLSAIIK